VKSPSVIQVCHPTQVHVNAHQLNPNQADRYSIHLPWRDGRLSCSGWLVIHWDCLPVYVATTR